MHPLPFKICKEDLNKPSSNTHVEITYFDLGGVETDFKARGVGRSVFYVHRAMTILKTSVEWLKIPQKRYPIRVKLNNGEFTYTTPRSVFKIKGHEKPLYSPLNRLELRDQLYN